jgi:membrane protease subunit HflK
MEPQDFIDLKKLNFKPPKKAQIFIGVAVLLGLFLFFTTWFQVEANSEGVILRLGKFNRMVGPGLHLKIPFGIESVTLVPSQRQLKEEYGFRTLRSGTRTQFSQQQFLKESLMLTGDLNVAEVEWSVQYRIADPFKYLFRVRNVRDSFRDITEAVMREIVGDRTVNEVLTVGRTELTQVVEEELQKLCLQYETGIKVEQVILQDVAPPDAVKPSFNEVNQAQQEREKLINEARGQYNLEVPRARGQADQEISQAQGYAIDRVNRARGEASRFEQLYAEYRRAPEVTRQRIYIETMSQVLPKVGRKFIIDENTKGLIPFLQLGKGGVGQ